MAIIKTEGSYRSADKEHDLHYCVWTPEGNPRGVIQICHGMNEFIERYQATAEYLAGLGYVICGNDMLGHGEACPPDDRGFFGSEDGVENIVADVEGLRLIMRKRYRMLPYFLLGHSMGSFVARAYVTRYPDALDGLILCGTSGTVKSVKNGLKLLRLLIALKGERYRSPFVYKLAYKGYNDRFAAEKDPVAWLSKNVENRQAAYNDERFNFIFTLRGYQTLLLLLQEISDPQWALDYPKSLPVLVLSGKDDPVGAYGSGPHEICDRLQDADVAEISLRLYDNCRHELFNEPEASDILREMGEWIDGVRDGVIEYRNAGWHP